MTLEQQKEELKRKLQMISSKTGNKQAKGSGNNHNDHRFADANDLNKQEDPDDEASRLRRKAAGKFVLNDFKFLSTLGTGTFG